MERLTKRQLKTRLGFTTDAALADFFGISAAAVYQWAEDGPVPLLRQLEAERKKPDAFRDAEAA